jgi:hypothetical protein
VIGLLLTGCFELREDFVDQLRFSAFSGDQGRSPSPGCLSLQILHRNAEGISLKMETEASTVDLKVCVELFLAGNDVLRGWVDRIGEAARLQYRPDHRA